MLREAAAQCGDAEQALVKLRPLCVKKPERV
jgi:hypothetical protein